ncbi:MAG: SusC/RagA family TonB-linked outer membrane protein, partial [Butyricimonas faecalis]
LHRGYLERTRYSTTNRAEYIHNLSSLVKGLEARASVSVSQAGYYTTGFKTEPAKYSLLNYDFETGKHTLQDLSSVSYRALTIDKDAQASTTDTRVTYEVRLLHGGMEEHQILWHFQHRIHLYTFKSFGQDATTQFNIFYAWKLRFGNAISSRVALDNGSERFAKNNRLGSSLQEISGL